MNQTANIPLRAFRDAVYHRYQVDPALQRPASELVEERASRFDVLKQAWPGSWGSSEEADRAIREDSELIRHWAVADLIAAQDARNADRDRIREAIFANAVKHPSYAATVARHSPELLRRTSSLAEPSQSIVDLTNASSVDSRLAALGYRMEPSLSSLDSEDDGDALMDLRTEELVDPPNEQVRELAEAWTAEQETLAPAREAMAVIARNHDRLLRAVDGVVPKEQLRSMVAEDTTAMRAITLPEQRTIAATSMSKSAVAHPGYAEALVEIDELAAREVAAADAARKQAEADYLLVQVERRRDLLDSGDAADLTAAAHADAEAVVRIATDEERLLALVVIGGRAQKLPVYGAALADVNRQVAEIAAAARSRVHDVFTGQPRDSTADASLEEDARNLSAHHAPDVSAGPDADQLSASAAAVAAKPVISQGELALPAPALSPEMPANPDSDDAAEAAAIESIRMRHSSRREAGAPVEAIASSEMERLVEADAADLKAIVSSDRLREAAADLEDCLSDPGYMNALETADLRTGAAMKSLYYDLIFRRNQEERKAEAARRRGIHGVLVNEGHAVHDFLDGSGERLSYYMKYVEDTGRTGTAWGDHLPAALRVAGAEIGDRIRFRWKSADEQTPDKSRFLLEVVERSQFADIDADGAAVKSSPSLPEEPRPPTANPTVSPAPSNAQAGTSHINNEANSELPRHQVGPDDEAPSPNSIGHGGRPAPTAFTTPPVIDERALDRLVAKRLKETADARAAAGLQPLHVDPAMVSASTIDATPSPARPIDPENAPSAKPKAAAQQPVSKPRPANPTANGVTGDSSDARPVPSEAIAKMLESVTYEVKSNGNVLYFVRGKAAFVDHGQQILMHDAGNEEDDAILAAVLLAKEKWGKVELTGTQAFKQRALELLAKHNLDVQLKNPEQDAILRQLVAVAPPPTPTEDGTKPLLGAPRASGATNSSPGSAATAGPPPGHKVEDARTPAIDSRTDTSDSAGNAAPKDAATSVAQASLAKDLAPIRAQEWWSTQRAAIMYWTKNKSIEREADLTKLGPEPSPEQIFWFDKGGRRCDPPADAKSFAESLAASDDNLKEMNMANTTSKGKGEEPPVLLRGVTKDGDEFKTTALLFKGQGNYLQGFIEAGGERHQVIVHINQRKPDADGVLRPNFLKVAERSGSGDSAQWKEIGYGNAVNHRSDGKVVYFDEVLFNMGQEVVKARVTSKVDPEMHTALGFLEARKSRSASAKPPVLGEAADPKQAPAAHAPEGAAGEGPTTKSRPSARARAAA